MPDVGASDKTASRRWGCPEALRHQERVGVYADRVSVRARLIRECPELGGKIPGWISPASGRRWTLHGGVLSRWTEELAPESSSVIELPTDARLLDVTADASLLAVAVDNHLLIHRAAGGEGATITVNLAAHTAAFVAHDQLLVASPRRSADGESSDGYRLVLLGLGGTIHAERTIEADNAAAFVRRHPTEASLLWDFPMGQDGTLLMRVRVVGDDLECTEVLAGDEAVPTTFSPDGTRVLLLPYPNDPDEVRVVSWPSFEVTAALDAATSVEGAEIEFGFGISGGFLSDDRVLLSATEGAPIVASSTLDSPQRVEMEGLSARLGEDGDVEVETLVPLSSDLFAAVLWTSGAPRLTTVWQLLD